MADDGKQKWDPTQMSEMEVDENGHPIMKFDFSSVGTGQQSTSAQATIPQQAAMGATAQPTSGQHVGVGATQTASQNPLAAGQIPPIPTKFGAFKDWPGFNIPKSSDTIVGARPKTATTLSGKFLSQSASIMTSAQKPTLAAPSSLQTLQPEKKQQIMLPDKKGILRPHHVRVTMVKHFNTIVSVEEMMDALSGSTTSTASAQSMLFPTLPTQSLGSVPSVTSARSSITSLISQASNVSITTKSEFVDHLRQLYQMMTVANGPQEIHSITMEIERVLHQLEQTPFFPTHIAGEENENFDAMDGIGNTTFPVNLEQASNHVITETSSANKNQGHLSSKPKKGFLRRLNSAISRVFLSKL